METPAVVVLGLAGLRLMSRVRRSGRVVRIAGRGRGHRDRCLHLRLARPVPGPSTVDARYVPVEAAGTRFAAVTSCLSDPAGLAGFADVGHGSRSLAEGVWLSEVTATERDIRVLLNKQSVQQRCWLSSGVNWALSPRDGIRELILDFRSGRTWGYLQSWRSYICQLETSSNLNTQHSSPLGRAAVV
jgi:hypothetical protein